MDDQLTTGAARVGGGGATNLAAAVAWRDRLMALVAYTYGLTV